MVHWVKIHHERNEYLVNFEYVTSFRHEANSRVTFWLPNTATPIVINPQTNLKDYQTILEYLENVTELKFEKAYWVKILYERNEYVINLNYINSFCHEPQNGRITFWLPDSNIPIIINPVSNPTSYQKVLEYIQMATGYLLGK
ncbi:MAG: hypothetical protein PUP93_16370 [Rhizonema sp. NSF051]|nr:hypothetical protein [Rhizonema sp. NSF051]